MARLVPILGLVVKCPVCPPESKRLFQETDAHEVSFAKTQVLRFTCPHCKTELEVQ